jgi:hypothetical protein
MSIQKRNSAGQAHMSLQNRNSAVMLAGSKNHQTYAYVQDESSEKIILYLCSHLDCLFLSRSAPFGSLSLLTHYAITQAHTNQ